MVYQLRQTTETVRSLVRNSREGEALPSSMRVEASRGEAGLSRIIKYLHRMINRCSRITS